MDILFFHETLDWVLIRKWFVFWMVGIRLLLAGIRQISKPEFTARNIFHIEGSESLVIVKELGFGNLAIGVGGILSLFRPECRQVAAIVGGLYFGLAGFQHLMRKRHQ